MNIIHPVLYPQDPKFNSSATPWTTCPVIIVGLPLKLHMQGRLIQAPSIYYQADALALVRWYPAWAPYIWLSTGAWYTADLQNQGDSGSHIWGCTTLYNDHHGYKQQANLNETIIIHPQDVNWCPRRSFEAGCISCLDIYQHVLFSQYPNSG